MCCSSYYSCIFRVASLRANGIPCDVGIAFDDLWMVYNDLRLTPLDFLILKLGSLKSDMVAHAPCTDSSWFTICYMLLNYELQHCWGWNPLNHVLVLLNGKLFEMFSIPRLSYLFLNDPKFWDVVTSCKRNGLLWGLFYGKLCLYPELCHHVIWPVINPFDT